MLMENGDIEMQLNDGLLHVANRNLNLSDIVCERKYEQAPTSGRRDPSTTIDQQRLVIYRRVNTPSVGTPTTPKLQQQIATITEEQRTIVLKVLCVFLLLLYVNLQQFESIRSIERAL